MIPNLIVTPASETGKSQGIDTATVRNVTALICCGTATHTDARQNSVAAPTSDAITAIIAT